MPSIDRNERARLLFRAEALDRRTHQPGQHGGCLKRSGLAVLRALLFGFANVATGRCDPGYDALARAANVTRSTVAVALSRLEGAGLVVRVRRQVGMTRSSNAYAFPTAEAAPNPSESGKSEFRGETTNRKKPISYRGLSTAPTAFWGALCPDMTPAEAQAAALETIRRLQQLRAARQAAAGT